MIIGVAFRVDDRANFKRRLNPSKRISTSLDGAYRITSSLLVQITYQLSLVLKWLLETLSLRSQPNQHRPPSHTPNPRLSSTELIQSISTETSQSPSDQAWTLLPVAEPYHSRWIRMSIMVVEGYSQIPNIFGQRTRP